MTRTLSERLATWLGALRRIVDLHPAVFSVGAWSAPELPASLTHLPSADPIVEAPEERGRQPHQEHVHARTIAEARTYRR
jgi:hypothetical protein